MVLGCNNYRVIDLGVMVPVDRILETAVEEDADMVGLSGLITPSLDEMVNVATEMERRGMTIPLLIGGATTSRQHTAVKIAPSYSNSVTHVLDASRAVGVVSRLLDPAQREVHERELRTEQDRLREQHATRRERKVHSYAEALSRRPVFEWRAEDVPTPEFTGRRVLENVPLREIAEYIDWTFFFHAWELRGKFPDVLNHPEHGAAARELYDNATALLEKLITDGELTASGVYGLWPANSEGEDIVLYADAERSAEVVRFPMLRQQRVKADEKPQYSLADFVAPRESGLLDHVGAFAVTAGLGAQELATAFEEELDDYSAIMVKAIADRLAEAFAEMLHARVRREWRYGADEDLSTEDLAAERYRGIRPAFGYPACPDHLPKRRLFDLLDAPAIGHEPEREPGHASGRLGERHLHPAPAGPLLRGRPHHQGSGRGLRRAHGRDPRGSRTLAEPQPGLRAHSAAGVSDGLAVPNDGAWRPTPQSKRKVHTNKERGGQRPPAKREEGPRQRAWARLVWPLDRLFPTAWPRRTAGAVGMPNRR